MDILYGLGLEEQDTRPMFEQLIDFLEKHNGKMPSGSLKKEGRRMIADEMTEEQKKEKSLYSKWLRSKERKILEEYAGKPIGEVPEEYREKIAKLREFGLTVKKKKLQQAKQQRDDAKAKNDKAKELEQQVLEQFFPKLKFDEQL